MKLVSTSIAAVAVLGAASTLFAQQTPIVGTGYNADVIADAGPSSTGPTVTTAIATGIDGQFAYVQNGYLGAASNGTATTGLPTGTTFVSQADANTSFALQAAAGNNTILLTQAAPTATFTLDTPTPYSSLSFLVTGTNGSPTAGYTLNYTDGSSTAGTVVAPDNFGGPNVAIFGNGRTQLTNNALQVFTDNPRLYQANAASIDGTKTLGSISFTGNALAGSGTTSLTNVALFGFSGTAVGVVPEPTTLGLAGVAGLGLLARRRRA